MENSQTHLFKTSLRRTRVLQSHFLLKKSHSSEKPLQLGSRTCSITLRLLLFNPKQIGVTESASRSFVLVIMEQHMGRLDSTGAIQTGKCLIYRSFLWESKYFWNLIVNVSSLWPRDKINVIIKVSGWKIDTGMGCGSKFLILEVSSLRTNKGKIWEWACC